MTDSTEAEVPPRTEAEPTEPVRRRRRVAAPQDSDTAAPSSKSEPKETTAQPETSGEVKRRTRRAPGSATPEAAEPPVSSPSFSWAAQVVAMRCGRGAGVVDGGYRRAAGQLWGLGDASGPAHARRRERGWAWAWSGGGRHIRPVRVLGLLLAAAPCRCMPPPATVCCLIPSHPPALAAMCTPPRRVQAAD